MVALGVSNLCFMLPWQFAQFVLLTQVKHGAADNQREAEPEERWLGAQSGAPTSGLCGQYPNIRELKSA